MRGRLHTHEGGNLTFERSTRSRRSDMNIGEIVREVEVLPAGEPAVPEPEPAHEEPAREPQPA